MYAVVALGAAVYLGFIYAYPRLFPYIEQADPENYRQNVEKALARGDTGAALDIARFATTWFRLDPDVYALYGELLLDAGDVQEARAQFETAVALTTTPAPESRPTRLPFFHTRARVGLGLIYWQQGDVVAAVTQFELARPFADLGDTRFRKHHQAMFDAYAALGAWSRALGFADPNTQRLGQLDREGLVAVIFAAEGAEKWEVLGQAGRALLSKDTGDPAGQYAVGRALAAQGKYDQATQALGSASELGHPNAPYFLGEALEQLGDVDGAVAAYRSTPQVSLYRAFALADAFLLMQESADNHDLDIVREDLLQTIESACPMPLVQTPPLLGVLPWPPLAMGLTTPPSAGTPIPLLVRWQDRSADTAALPEFSVQRGDHGQMVLRHAATILQFQWAPNQLPLADFEHFDVGLRNPPGCFDPDALWRHSGELPVGEVAPGSTGPGRVLHVSSDSQEKRAILYSLPVPLRAGSLYVLAARIHAPDTRAVFGWEFLGEREELVQAGNTVNQQPVPEWSWHSAVTQAQYPWKMARALFGIYQATGNADFDHLMFLELATPAKPSP